MAAPRFQQQEPMTNFSLPKEAKHPQHGQQPNKECQRLKEPRSFEPRPGH